MENGCGHVTSSVPYVMQVVEQALVKLFDAVGMKALVITMSELLATTDATRSAVTPVQATPISRGNITVSYI